MTTETTNNMDSFLKWLQWFAFVAIGGAATIITFYFIYTWGPISSNQNDWASLGTLLSGVFSFLGAIGTVGVMFLGIKQFKMQQNQITKQNKILDAQEKRANFDLYQNHLSSFKLFLTELENELKTIRFTNKNQLYQEVFPHNTQSSCSFAQENNIYLEKQIQAFNVTMAKCKEAKRSEDINGIIGSFGSLNEELLIEFEKQNFIGEISYISKSTNLKPLGVNVHLIDEYTYILMTLLERLTSFANVNIAIPPHFTHLEDNTALLEYSLNIITEDNHNELTRIAILSGDYYEACLTYLIEMQSSHEIKFIFCRNNLIDKESFIKAISLMKKAHDISKHSAIENIYNNMESHLKSPIEKLAYRRR